MSKSECYDSDNESYKPPSPEEDLKFITEHPKILPHFGSDHEYLEIRTQRNQRSQSATRPFFSYEDTPLRASLIIPSLYLSDAYTATSPTVLSNLGITHIVSLVATPRHDYPVIQALDILHIQLEDSVHAKLEEYFESSSSWIQDALANGESKVLVHCEVGASRSPTIVIAYLMAMKGMSYDTALAHVQERRRVVRPNFGFVKQLKGLEQRLNDPECTDTKLVERHGLRSTLSST